MNQASNIFTFMLGLLDVKHTSSFSDPYFNEHPHKYNLFGLSKMLFDYGINNVATRIPDKEKNITEIQMPFIAQFGGDFIVVHKIESDKVTFFWKGIHHVLPVAKFINSWTGVVLLAESSVKSIEPDYQEHRKAELLTHLKQIILFCACILIAVFAYINNSYHTNPGISLLLFINLTGLYISFQLFLKQIHIQSRYADKICSLFKQKDCNNVLESKAAKLFGMISWSEIGSGYFLTNIILLLVFPTSITAIALLNILALPFTLWSVWYQQAKAGQWCVLCLIVVTSLWAIFTINIIFGYIHIPYLFVHCQLSIVNCQLVITACCYCVSVLGINMLAPKLNTDKKIQSLQQSLNSIKADETVFKTLLKKQPYFETNITDSIIRFGNPDSKLRLTVLTNPYCNPCANMHERIDELLSSVNNEISVQYILSSFGENLKSTNRYLIAACLATTAGSEMQIFSDWFEKGKELKDDYFKSFSLDMANPEIDIEMQKHETWIKKTQIRATPTVLVNGYQLPDSYKIEDLQHFTDLDF
ncbi:MAG: thioredoxin domain-containing protein [Tannerella sp.]|jgi:hypothetical protein|nr:thioredoxin domain-containing protein [Tannerella sp.]